MENWGFWAAIGAAVCWGSYMVPFKKSHSSNLRQFQAMIAVGVGISGLLLAPVLGYPLNLNIYGLLSGSLWAVANAASLVAVLNLGISRAVPLMSSLVILSSFLWGVLVFHELPGGLAAGFVGIGLIVAGVVIVSITGNIQSQNIKRGLITAISAGLIFGSQLVPLKMGSVATKDFFWSVCLGIFLTGVLIALALKTKFKNESVKMGLLSGVIWNIGNLLSLISVSMIGLSKAGPISQLAVLVAVVWGLFYFKEITKPKHRVQVLIGAMVILIGVVTLAMA